MSDPVDFYRMHSRISGADYDFSAHEYDLIVVPVVYCKCDEPFVKTWTDGRVFCTRCGNVAHPDERPVLGAGDGASPMPTADEARAAYERLYKNRIEMTMVKWGFTPHEAALNAQAEWDGAEITDFTDDPEAAADESMSYWDHDG